MLKNEQKIIDAARSYALVYQQHTISVKDVVLEYQDIYGESVSYGAVGHVLHRHGEYFEPVTNRKNQILYFIYNPAGAR